MFDHIFPKAWTSKQDIDIGGFLLSCYQFCKTVGGGAITKYVLHPPKKEPITVEIPFSREITRQLESESYILPKTPTTDYNPLNGDTLLRDDSNPLSLRMNKNPVSGTVRGPPRHNATRSGLNDLLKKENSASTTSDHYRLTYIVFGKVTKECCISCVFLEGEDNWLSRAQEVADKTTARFEELYEDAINNLKKDFETIKSEVEIDQNLIDKVRNTFIDFTKDMNIIKDNALTTQNLANSSTRPNVSEVFTD
jgi:archaellum component FlaC